MWTHEEVVSGGETGWYENTHDVVCVVATSIPKTSSLLFLPDTQVATLCSHCTDVPKPVVSPPPRPFQRPPHKGLCMRLRE